MLEVKVERFGARSTELQDNILVIVRVDHLEVLDGRPVNPA
jgi:hypothetical protein